MTANLELLIRRLISDAMEIADIEQEQIDLFSMREFETVIEIGNIWTLQFLHTPHAMGLDLWSARAQRELQRQDDMVRHLFRADQIYRRWERAIQASSVELTFEDRVVVLTLLTDVMDQLELLLDFDQDDSCVHKLWQEYEIRCNEFD